MGLLKFKQHWLNGADMLLSGSDVISGVGVASEGHCGNGVLEDIGCSGKDSEAA